MQLSDTGYRTIDIVWLNPVSLIRGVDRLGICLSVTVNLFWPLS